MKRCFLITALLYCFSALFAQSNYEMVVEMNDGTKNVFDNNEIKQVFFQAKDSGSGSGEGGSSSSDTGTYQGAKRIFGDLLLGSIYNETDNITETWTFDDNGFPTKIISNHPTKNYTMIPTYSDGQVLIKTYNGNTFVSQYIVTIGSNGYASKIEFTDDNGNPETCSLTYNADEQLSTITWGTSDITRFTYSDGDIICIDDNGTISEVAYETTTQSKILNSGNFILWDEMLPVDMDDIQELHFAGLLGKATKHLPLAYVKNSNTYNNRYELDSSGRVTMFTKSTATYDYDVLRITWSNDGGSSTPVINASDLIGTWRATTSAGIEMVTLNDGNSSWQVYNSSGTKIASGVFTWTLSNNTINLSWISSDTSGAATSVVISNLTSNSFTAVTNLSKTYNFTRNNDDSSDDTSLYKIVFSDGYKTEYNSNGFVLLCIDDDDRMTVDQTGQPYFGTAENYQKYSSRLKPGGASSIFNSLSLTIPYAGTLKIAARSSSSSATNRNLVLTQNGTTILDKIVKENESTDYETAEVDGENYKIFPIISVPVQAGTVYITYPNGSINFHCFEFIKADDSGSGSGEGGSSSSDTGTYQGAKRIFGDLLLGSIYNETDNITETWTFDDNGFPTKIISNHPTKNYTMIPTYSDGQVLIKTYNGNTFVSQYIVTIGSNGYASKIEFTDDNGNPETCSLTYNADEQLSTITWGTSDITRFTYSDGDIICIDDNGTISEVAYETTTQSKILNSGNFILWDEMLPVDMDDIQELHFAGLLGKATKHLPLAYVKNSNTYNNRYELDSSGRVTMFTKSTATYDYDVLRITWNNDGGSSYDGDSPSSSTGTFQGAKRVFGDNLMKAFGREGYDRYDFTYDSNGFVTQIHRTKYGTDGGSDTEYDVNITYNENIVMNTYKNGSLQGITTINIGSNGFASSLTWNNDKATLSYDSNNQLTSISYLYDNKTEVNSFTYSGGNIIQSAWDGEVESSIAYTSPTQSAIENIAGVMEYDDVMGIDFDDFVLAYYCGMVGFGTKSLPLAYTSSDSTAQNTWTLDGSGRAIKVSTVHQSKTGGSETSTTFFWEW